MTGQGRPNDGTRATPAGSPAGVARVSARRLQPGADTVQPAYATVERSTHPPGSAGVAAAAARRLAQKSPEAVVDGDALILPATEPIGDPQIVADELAAGDWSDARTAMPKRRPFFIRAGARVARWALTLAIWGILLLVVALTWGTHVFDYRTHVIIGQSMEPNIPLWSVVIGTSEPDTSIRRGDVITFTPPNDTDRVTHRVTDIDFDDEGDVTFKTMGDNNENVDPWTIKYTNHEAWKVQRHIPYVGWLLLQMQTKVGRILFIVVPTLLILVSVMRWIWRSDSKADDANERERRDNITIDGAMDGAAKPSRRERRRQRREQRRDGRAA